MAESFFKQNYCHADLRVKGIFSTINVTGARTGLASLLDNTSATQAKFRSGHEVLSQPRPQGAFPWLWGRGGKRRPAPKAREKRPGDEVGVIRGAFNFSWLYTALIFMQAGMLKALSRIDGRNILIWYKNHTSYFCVCPSLIF